jgi:hypothetical protein
MSRWRTGAIVAVGWGALLGVFVVINAGYGAGALVLLMFAGSVVLAGSLGLVLSIWSGRQRPGTRRWPVPRVVTSAPLLAAAAALVGVGVAFTWALYPLAFWLVVLAGRRYLRERAGLRAARSPEPDQTAEPVRR